MINTQYINLNMTPSGVMPVLYCSQYDVGRPLGMVVYNGSESVDLDTYTCTIEATRTDGTAITAAVITDDNIGVFTTTATMTNKEDKYLTKLVLFDSNSRRVASLAFMLRVTPATMDENAESIEEDASLYQQYTGTVQTLIAEIREDLTDLMNDISAEATIRQTADSTLQSNITAEATARTNAITAEATARQAEDTSLRSAIAAEAAARASEDAVLQAEIDQMVAPSGEAPSAVEVTNARIGADGVTYSTLGDAIRTQMTNAVNADTLGKVVQYNGDLYVDISATFEQGNFTSSGNASSTKWVRTPSGSKIAPDGINNEFLIFNPDALQWAIGIYALNGSWIGYDYGGQVEVQSGIYRDAIYKYVGTDRYRIRLRVARYLASGDLTPAQCTLKVYRKLTVSMTDTHGVYRTVSPAVGNGAILSDGTVASGDYYRYTDIIYLQAGETIHFEFAGPSNLLGLSQWTPSRASGTWTYTFNQALITGDGGYHVSEYTAPADMYVRVSTMIYHTSAKPYTNADDLLTTMYIFKADSFYDKTSPLYGKTITLMGDSLAYGSNCGNGAVWLQRLALKHNMTAYNLGINGNAVTSGYGTDTPMCERYSSIPQSDYIVVEGGANDKGGAAPIGTFWSDETNHVMNTDTSTFMGALNTIISGLRGMYPKAKLLFLTDYDRYPSKFQSYIDAMKTVCKMRSVPCFDNFADSGVAVCEDGLKGWQDEGLWLGYPVANQHFTPEVYKTVLLPKYENVLMHL